MKNVATELGIILIGYFTLVPAIQVRLKALPLSSHGVCAVISCKLLIESMLLCQRSQTRTGEENLTLSKFYPLTRPRMQTTPFPC